MFTKPAEPGDAIEQGATFQPADVQDKVKLRAGDTVEFSLVEQGEAATAGCAATEVVLVGRAGSVSTKDGGQLLGCVISVKEGFGFIR